MTKCCALAYSPCGTPIDSRPSPDGCGLDWEVQATKDIVEEDTVFYTVASSATAIGDDFLGMSRGDGDGVRKIVVESEVFVG